MSVNDPNGGMPTVPCETCGEPTTFLGTKRCNNCWEVEGRLARYLRSAGGRRNVAHALSDAAQGALKANPKLGEAVLKGRKF